MSLAFKMSPDPIVTVFLFLVWVLKLRVLVLVRVLKVTLFSVYVFKSIGMGLIVIDDSKHIVMWIYDFDM